MRSLFASFVLALVLCGAVLAKEMPGFSKLPRNWSLLSKDLPKDRQLSLKIALHPKDGARLEQSLIELSTPGNANFRKWLKPSQITEMVGNDDSKIQKVMSWLTEYSAVGVSVHPHKDWITATTSVENIEKMFNCKLASYLNSRTQSQKVGAVGSYIIPDSIADVVQMVAGMTSFSAGHWATPLEVNANAAPAAGVPASITPTTIYEVYMSDKSGSHGSKLGSQAVVEFGNVANFNEADTQTFFKQYQPALLGETCGVVAGTNNGDIRPSVEANLDVQYIMAAGPFVNTTDYKIVGSAGIEDMFLDYTMLVNSQNSPPLVHSISYGEYGGSYDNVTDQRFSYELQKMGISGVSVLLASGDNGIGCDADGTTQEFDYPSSPYITMVGATYIDSVTKKEVGATLSSGGFSKDFMQASWQADAVNAYFNTNPVMPHEDFYRPGRAYPDVSAFGQNVQVIAQGKVQAVSGTSCSAPILGGLFAAINHDLMSAGHSPLGFVNPWLYANPQMFYDVLTGSNPYQKCDGFQAAKGWDPVTGMGTPLYPQMRAAAFASATAAKK